MEHSENLNGRREGDCPCKYIVELDGNINLVKAEAEHAKASLRSEVMVLLADYKDMNLQVKECLMSMQQSALMFNDGNHKFDAIRRELKCVSKALVELEASIDNEAHSIEKILGESLLSFIRRWHGMRKTVAAWAVVVTMTLMMGGHVREAQVWLKGWF